MSKSGRLFFYPIIKFCEWFAEKCPVSFVKVRYLARFHKLPNLKNPEDLNEKILYLKLFTDISKWTELADKVRVRDYLKQCNLEQYLIPLLGHWSRVEDIDFDSLPNSFIFKANNGTGKSEYIIVKDKDKLDIKQTKKILNSWLKNRHVGSLSAEPHYKNIPPQILAEVLLPPEEGKNAPVDYKIWCFNGKAYFIRTYSGRDKNGAEVMTYDRDWNPMPEVNIPNSRYKNGNILPKPQNLEEMISIAETLTKPFPQVRLDLYNINGKIYFGEMTFTSHGGMMNNLTPEFLKKAGSLIDLNP